MKTFKEFLGEAKKAAKKANSPLRFNNPKLPSNQDDYVNTDSVPNIDNSRVPGFQGTRLF